MSKWRTILTWEVEAPKPSWPPNGEWRGWLVFDHLEDRYGIIRVVMAMADGFTYRIYGKWALSPEEAIVRADVESAPNEYIFLIEDDYQDNRFVFLEKKE